MYRLEAALREAVVHWRLYPAMLCLQTMRGVQCTKQWACAPSWASCHASCTHAS